MSRATISFDLLIWLLLTIFTLYFVLNKVCVIEDFQLKYFIH